MPELKQALGTEADATVFHKLAALDYRTSYSHRGRFYALDDTLFLALPVSWSGTVQQYAGRLHRLHERKREVQIYDYVDSEVPMLARMHQKRVRGYAAIGYSVATVPVPDSS